ncbi:MAG: FAD-binding oxidoreductase [Candidatus Obscuribacterales bacterium]|nr:FAD-binding oxidoreductase [Candidatus Obscuribacterales bacterium]
MAVVYDVHSGLESGTGKILQINSLACLQKALAAPSPPNSHFIAQGARHAMGGQQFIDGGTMLDLRPLNRLLSLDCRSGTAKFESGASFKDVIEQLNAYQNKKGTEPDNQWTIRQKPTGVDSVTLGGAVSSNIHGRGLKMSPFAADVEAIELLTPQGDLINLKLELEGAKAGSDKLFRHAVGGFGLFGVITAVTLRLKKRQTVQREVSLCRSEDLIGLLEKRIAGGAEYGDFQFAIDSKSEDFLSLGILSTYKPVPVPSAQVDELQGKQASLSPDNWRDLIYLAHIDKKKAFKLYSDHYMRTNGQLYLTDAMQLSTYFESYHREMKHEHLRQGSEIITELYVPVTYLPYFLKRAATILRARKADLIYGTVRLIEKDNISALPWAREQRACIVFNLHVEPSTLLSTKETLRELIDLALALAGSFYLTYHRYFREDQIRHAYPEIEDFLAYKCELDPQWRLRNNWLLDLCKKLNLKMESHHQTVR